MMSKLRTLVTLLVFLCLGLIFFDSLLHREIFSDKYGLNPVSITAIFVTAEIFFNIGVFLMLKGTGVFKVRLKDIFNFKLEKAHFSTKLFVIGFIMNRASATLPWLYVLGVGWRRLPLALSGLIVLELLIVSLLTLGVFEFMKKHDYQTS